MTNAERFREYLRATYPNWHPILHCSIAAKAAEIFGQGEDGPVTVPYIRCIAKEQIRAIIREELAKAAGGWQPIESAPKDGTRILVVTHMLVEVAKWGTSNCWIAENGRVSLAASHWQPLPSPPPEQSNG